MDMDKPTTSAAAAEHRANLAKIPNRYFEKDAVEETRKKHLRFRHKPLFLHRTLRYMKGRMSRIPMKQLKLDTSLESCIQQRQLGLNKILKFTLQGFFDCQWSWDVDDINITIAVHKFNDGSVKKVVKYYAEVPYNPSKVVKESNSFPISYDMLRTKPGENSYFRLVFRTVATHVTPKVYGCELLLHKNNSNFWDISEGTHVYSLQEVEDGLMKETAGPRPCLKLIAATADNQETHNVKEENAQNPEDIIQYKWMYLDTTEMLQDATCFMCHVGCLHIDALMKHLKFWHSKFKIICTKEANIMSIQVSLDLSVQPSFRSLIRMSRDESGSTMNESFLLYNRTCRPIHQVEPSVTKIDGWSDCTEKEKLFCKLWNMFRIRHVFVGDSQTKWACEKFLHLHGPELARHNMYRNFVQHLSTLANNDLLTPQKCRKLVLMAQSILKPKY